MSEQLDKYLRPASQQSDDQDVVQVPQPYEGSFIDQVIQPLYEVIAAVCLKFVALQYLNLLW